MNLRERKKALIRQAILENAERLFEERGFDNVTVAEIADAANVSVKTLFVYFRSKEDLAFADTTLIDMLVTALRERAAGLDPAQALGQALRSAVEQDNGADLEGFHRFIGDSSALRSRLLRMWAEYEDTMVTVLAERDGPPTPRTRLRAAQLIAVVRSLTSPEVREAVGHGATAEERRRIMINWLDEATEAIAMDPSSAGRPAMA